MPSAEGEGTRVVLLGGEPGSGKSRLVREFAAEAAADGAPVLYGACDAEVRTPYGPFVEALDQLVRATEPDELRAALGGRRRRPHPAAARPRLPHGRSRPGRGGRPGHRAPPAAHGGRGPARRHRARAPALLVLEDVHWADAPTLLLLRHLARAGSARILLLATFRDTEAEMPDALSEPLADLRRYDTIRLGLAGLSGEEVAEFVRSAGGEARPRPRELATRSASSPTATRSSSASSGGRSSETGGASGTSPAEPESVREVVSQRLSRLAPGTTDLLELAATAGAEFELDMVRRAAGLGEPELLAALDEAVRSGMIEEVPSHGLACRFTHELVRRALYDRLSGPRRAELHLRVGEALERGSGRSARAIADLAHHFASAAPFGGTARAVEYNVLAARAATAALAFDEAAARLRTALALGIEGPEERLELSLELGQVSNRGGKALDALAAFRAAAEIARDLGDAHGLARAATGYEDACWRPGMTDQGAVEMLEEAAMVLGDEDSALRVGLLGGLARALDFQGHHERGEIVRTNAVEMARRMEDQVGLAGVLVRSYWSRGTTPLDEILAMLTEARDISARSWATPRSAPRRCPGGCRRSWRCPTSTRRGARWPRCSRRPSRQPSRSSSTWPSTTARRSRSATGAWTRPRREPGARTSGAAC